MRRLPNSEMADVLRDIAANAAAHDVDGSFPFEAFPPLWQLGVLNLTIPVAKGGAGAGLAVCAEVVRSIGEADPCVALIVAQHLTAHNNLRRLAWPEAVRDMVQQSSVDGVALINSLRVEPELGTPGRGGRPATTAHRLPDGGGWRITGRKIYSTGIPLLRWMLVWATTDDAEPSVGAFLAESGTPGYAVERTWEPLGMRATRSDDVVFTDLVVPLDHAVDVMSPEDRTAGIDPIFAIWNAVLMGSVYHGVARAARDWLAGYLNERVPANLGAPLSSLPRFHEAFGALEAQITMSDRLLRSMADDVDSGLDPDEAAAEANLVKRAVTNAAIDVVLGAVRLIGNPGLSGGHPLERHLRNVLHGPVHTPQDDTITVATGRAALQR
ncbi:MAG: Acyl-CoA dehydrogenase type 2 domain protein [Ilumatobacteraceae bacterium]|nr:Acyl-CoA dehydrogenase type 2 domain protein [Ilumatobacteraceae bacterium]MCU1388098.1 Acyl-CoA dehydrogenase type 2 domain protein [Ilumatobacteraceae bacterium]